MKRGKRISIIIFLMIVSLIIMSACTRQSGGFGGMKKDAAPLSVIVEVVQPRELKEYIKIVGTLEGITDITLSSEVNGKIVEIYKHLGDWVNKGDAIGRIDNADYQNMVDQAKASLLAAEASHEAAQLNLTTTKALYEKDKTSKVDYLNAQISYKSALASLEAAKAGLESAKRTLNNSRFVAPVSGYITSITLEVGEMVAAGSPVCTIVNSKKLIIKTGISESDIKDVKIGQDVSIRYDNYKQEYKAKIIGIGIKPLAGTANYPIEIEMENPSGSLLPGMVVEGYILAQVYEDVIYTSLNNIVEKYDDRLVYVIDDENVAHRVMVKLGNEVDRNVIIKEGVKPGDKLVREGYENLQEGTKVIIKSVYQPETSS
ncbi:MAG TPA: efflux RND transporter periplasmic adaptor subunit [Candidatus Cloacimonetes bacterium]|nr:efflux RND transporter periplasmic adaptor subunit [Candidatus Cloacimonadota bacterium]